MSAGARACSSAAREICRGSAQNSRCTPAKTKRAKRRAGYHGRRAAANLEAICREYLKDGHKLEVVDVPEHPRRALAEGVLVTPSLSKLSPLPAANVVGKGGPEQEAIEAGEIDAIIDHANSNVILLPAARRALRQAAWLAASSRLR